MNAYQHSSRAIAVLVDSVIHQLAFSVLPIVCDKPIEHGVDLIFEKWGPKIVSEDVARAKEKEE